MKPRRRLMGALAIGGLLAAGGALSARQQQPPPRSGRIADLHSQAETDIGALNRDHDRQQDKPRLVAHLHTAVPSRFAMAALSCAYWRV